MHEIVRRFPKLLASFDWLSAVAVFVVYALIDAMYAWYTLSVTDRRPFAAANVSFAMHFLLAYGVISYTVNPLYVLPLACGSWLGTYLVVRRDKDKGRKPSRPPGHVSS